MDWFKIGKGVCQVCLLSPCLFSFYVEYIIWNAKPDESQATNEVARKNVSNVRYADDTTLMAESEEELKSLLMKVKEENEKTGIKLNIQKTKIIVSGPITLWQIHREEMETVADIIFLGSKCTVDGDCIHVWNTVFRKPSDEPQTERNYFQNTYQRKDLYSIKKGSVLKLYQAAP